LYNNVDDVGFIRYLLNDVESSFNIDKKRIYAGGYSNGAQFTYRLSKQMTDRLAAISTVAGQRLSQDELGSPNRPISIMQFSGLMDKIAPYNGGLPKEGKVGINNSAYSVKEVIGSWINFNKCPKNITENKRIGKAVMVRYTKCNDNTEVILWTLEDGGHTWPGGKISPNVEKLGLGSLGPINKDISASNLMWEFFKRHTLN